ncbi:hypothetical protein L596_007331 [Steinernema carpocapsae]|uniref:Large ribosomal subunit protein eL24-related N-terminal domain-containing protein n=1 Tax=Steinernema carpocapsae TaxID=34508 RepID=A0A4U5P908_STECR|nr:hypothetical protein L596_007331 [Steinernema carpocapsae]
MKLETCVYSGYKIHPGHGKRLIRADGKVQIYLNKKCQRASWALKRNPVRSAGLCCTAASTRRESTPMTTPPSAA